VPQLLLLLRGRPAPSAGHRPARLLLITAPGVSETTSGRSTPLAGQRHGIRRLPDEPTERSLLRDPPSHPVSSTRTGYGSKGGHPHRLRNV